MSGQNCENQIRVWIKLLLVIALISEILLTSNIFAKNFDQKINIAESIVYYGDYYNDKVYVIDIDNMTLLKTFSTESGPYPVDLTSDDTVYISTRKANSIGVIDNHELTYEGIIKLKHKPRSSHYNKNNGLALVSGADKPMTTMIKVKNGQVRQSHIVGRDEIVTPTDYGGGLATGHPYWIDKRHFFLLDREARKIFLYNKNGKLLSELSTPTSVHHIVTRNRAVLPKVERMTFYAVAEGSPANNIAPAILRFVITEDKQLIMTGLADLNYFEPTIMGAHHADFDPSGQYVYMGSAEGHTFIIDKDSMNVVKIVDTGKKAGHTTFSASRNMAIVTNHADTFITLIDTVTHEKIADITVAGVTVPGRLAQSHTASVSPDGKYFYSAASSDGIFYELDLDSLSITRTLYIGGYPIQGVFSW